MTDQEINIKLVRAIGWKRVDVATPHWLMDAVLLQWWGRWKTFDYRDWNDIAPIAAHFNCFPRRLVGRRDWYVMGPEGSIGSIADTPQKAIAMIVIGGSVA